MINFRRLLLIMVIPVGLIVSCGDPAVDEAERVAQILQDSLDQASLDNKLIDAYIANAENGIDDAQVIVGDFGVRHFVWNPEVSGRVPKGNDIVSINYTGKFLNNVIFDTTSETVAFTTDSTLWVEKGVDFNANPIVYNSEEFVNDDKDMDAVLKWLASSDIPLENPLYVTERLFLPVIYNHSPNGRGISSDFISGFRTGLTDVSNKMELGSMSIIIIPSAVAYGETGTPAIEPNTVLIFEFNMVNIRP